MKINIILIAAFLCGCQFQHVNAAYTLKCDINEKDFVSQKDFVLKLWECGKKNEAKRIAKSEAGIGNAEMADIYLQILASDDEDELGLAYALKYAEQGNEPASRWVLRIAIDQKINSLAPQISKFYSKIFESAPEYPYLYLEEYLVFAAQSLAQEDNDSDSSSRKFYMLSKDKLSKVENARIQKLLLNVENQKNRWRKF